MSQYCESLQTCGYFVVGRCVRCNRSQCGRHLGTQRSDNPLDRWTPSALIDELWALHGDTLRDYRLIQGWISDRYPRYSFDKPTCVSCRFEALLIDAEPVLREAKMLEQKQQQLAVRQFEYVQQNWEQILRQHRRVAPSRRRRTGFLSGLTLWLVKTDSVSMGVSSAYGEPLILAYTYHFIDAQNAVYIQYQDNKPHLLGPFDPQKITSSHWLFELARRYNLLPQE